MLFISKEDRQIEHLRSEQQSRTLRLDGIFSKILFSIIIEKKKKKTPFRIEREKQKKRQKTIANSFFL